MGRTVKSFRIALGEEEARWEGASSRLDKSHKILLKETVASGRLYASAASMAVRPSVFEVFFMSLLFDAHKGVKVGRGWS